MPIFEYKCKKCAEKFEEFRSLSNPEPPCCPNCHSEETIKLFSTFASCCSDNATGDSPPPANCSQGNFT